MNTNTDKFPTYAEYARRSLLRLRIVKAVSEELMVQIILRGINDAQIRAAALNSNLTVENLVSFMAIYVKPKANSKFDSRRPTSNNFPKKHQDVRCHDCGQLGHICNDCPKKINDDKSQSKIIITDDKSKPICSFCNKVGHKENYCFSKLRTSAQNNTQKSLNLCTQITDSQEPNV